MAEPHTKLGVIELEATDGSDSPTLLMATTVNVYAVPLVKPVTSMGELVPIPAKLPGSDVTL